jgi:hypothetical protein
VNVRDVGGNRNMKGAGSIPWRLHNRVAAALLERARPGLAVGSLLAFGHSSVTRRHPVLVRTWPVMLLTLTLLLALASSAHAVATFSAAASFNVDLSEGNSQAFGVTVTNTALPIPQGVETPGATLFLSSSLGQTALIVDVQANGQTGPPPSEASVGSLSALLEFDIENLEDDFPIGVLGDRVLHGAQGRSGIRIRGLLLQLGHDGRGRVAEQRR